MYKLIAILILTATLLAARPAFAGCTANYPGCQAPDPEGEYYRGAYDACLFIAAYAGLSRQEAVGGCRQAIEQARVAGWYEQPSPGWGGMQRLPTAWGQET